MIQDSVFFVGKWVVSMVIFGRYIINMYYHFGLITNVNENEIL